MMLAGSFWARLAGATTQFFAETMAGELNEDVFQRWFSD